MPLQDDMRLISVDDHVIEHATVFSDRLPTRFRDAGPRLITADRELRGGHILGEVVVREGEQTWVYEDRLYPQLALNAVAGLDPKEWLGREPTRYDQIRPGCYDPGARLADMDTDGIHAMLLFPTFPRFAGTTFLDAEDKSVALLCVQAWNDFIIDEWSGPAPGRFIPMMILPLWDVELCVAEVRRMAARGAKCIAFPENPYPLGLPSWSSGHWDPLCAVAQEHALPLCMHFGTSGRVAGPSPDCNPLAVTVSFGLNSMMTMSDLLFSTVFHDFPDLRVVLSEGGIGWMPWLLERAETVWDRHRWYGGVNTDVNPRDLFARHIYGCFISDDAGISQREVIGVDNIMWECDYPHADSNWPNARKQLAESLLGVPDDEVHKIVELNARRVFDFWD